MKLGEDFINATCMQIHCSNHYHRNQLEHRKVRNNLSQIQVIYIFILKINILIINIYLSSNKSATYFYQRPCTFASYF